MHVELGPRQDEQTSNHAMASDQVFHQIPRLDPHSPAPADSNHPESPTRSWESGPNFSDLAGRRTDSCPRHTKTSSHKIDSLVLVPDLRRRDRAAEDTVALHHHQQSTVLLVWQLWTLREMIQSEAWQAPRVDGQPVLASIWLGWRRAGLFQRMQRALDRRNCSK